MSPGGETSGLLERWRSSFESLNAGDVDAALAVWGRDPVWDLSPMGLGVYEGLPAIRGFWEEWIGTYEDLNVHPEETLDLGGGVTFATVLQQAHPARGSGELSLRYAAVAEWAGGLVARITNYSDIAEGRAAADVLADATKGRS